MEEDRLTQAGDCMLDLIRDYETKDDIKEETLMMIFDVAYRQAYLGSLSVYLSKARPSETCAAIKWIRYIALTNNEAILKELFNAKVDEMLFKFVLQIEVCEENEDAVAHACIALANMHSDFLPAVQGFCKGPWGNDILHRVAKWKDSLTAIRGILQFLCALVSVKFPLLKEMIEVDIIDICVYSTINAGDVRNFQQITDALSVIEFMTDVKENDEEKPFANLVLYLLDKNFYQACFDALADVDLPVRLRVVASRIIGNASSLTNYPEIDRV